MESGKMAVAETQTENQQVPCACNFLIFNNQEKQRHSELMRKIDGAIAATRELPDGYAFHLVEQKISIIEVAEWIGHERHCCPFFHFEVELQPNRGELWLKLRGSSEVKEFLRPDVERRTVFEPKF